MSHTAVQRFYRYHACLYDWTRWPLLHGRRSAAAGLDLQPTDQVLDVGCGTGLNLRYLLNYLDPTAGHVTGVDFSPNMLARAERRVTARGWSNVTLVQADATALELGRSFDAVLFAYSLSMIPDWPAALERAFTHLRPGGRLAVLDFGQFRHWGPLRPLIRTWLRFNHVDTEQPYIDRLRALFADVEVAHRLGGYCFAATGRKPDDCRGQ